MQLGSSKDRFPCFTRLNPCVAHCSTYSIPWVHHSREEGSLDYDGGLVRLQIHVNFDTNIHRQQGTGRGPPYHGRIFTVTLPSSPAEPPLFKVASPRARRHCHSRCHGRRLSELPFSRAFHHRPTHPTPPQLASEA
jgi:hypothetical protein